MSLTSIIVLPGESHGQRSPSGLVGYSPQGHKGSDTTEWQHFQRIIALDFQGVSCVQFLKNNQLKIIFIIKKHVLGWQILLSLPTKSKIFTISIQPFTKKFTKPCSVSWSVAFLLSKSISELKCLCVVENIFKWKFIISAKIKVASLSFFSYFW